MEWFFALVRFLNDYPVVGAIIEAVSIVLMGGLFWLMHLYRKEARQGRAAIHNRIDAHEVLDSERWGEIKAVMDIVKARLAK